jgi:glycosyltransferase involved in cell wall biosynthesis
MPTAIQIQPSEEQAALLTVKPNTSFDGVSVIIPAYNCGAEISQAVECALNQQNVTVEVIVIDDGSTDDTANIVQLIQSQHPASVRVFSQDNHGPAAARNLGIQQAAYEWIAFLDHDDMWTPNKLIRQLDSARATESALVVTAAKNFDETDRVGEVRRAPHNLDSCDVYHALLRDNFVTLSSVLVRRSTIKEAGGFDERWKGVEDWALWLSIAELGVRFASINEPLVGYRWHGQSLSHRHDSMQRQRQNLIRQALSTPRGRALNGGERRRIQSEERICSGWFMAEQSTSRAALFYVQALIAWPFAAAAWKGLIKSLLGRK